MRLSWLQFPCGIRIMLHRPALNPTLRRSLAVKPTAAGIQAVASTNNESDGPHRRAENL
jgi:hypothetical protein